MAADPANADNRQAAQTDADDAGEDSRAPQDGSREAPDDRMSEDDDPAHGYARAIMSAAGAEGVLERVSDELYRFGHVVESNSELRERLTDERLTASLRLGIVEDLLGPRAHPRTTSAVLWLVQSGRARQLSSIAEILAELTAERREREVAEARTAVELDADQRERLVEAIQKATGKHIDLKVVVDPEIMGGVVVQVGDTVIDGSVARRLSDLRARLSGQ